MATVGQFHKQSGTYFVSTYGDRGGEGSAHANFVIFVFNFYNWTTWISLLYNIFLAEIEILRLFEIRVLEILRVFAGGLKEISIEFFAQTLHLRSSIRSS